MFTETTAVMNANLFITQRGHRSTIQDRDFSDVSWHMRRISREHTVDLKTRIKLIEKLYACCQEDISVLEFREQRRLCVRLMRFLGFSYSVFKQPLPYSAKVAQETYREVIKDLSVREKAYQSKSRLGPEKHFQYLVELYHNAISCQQGRGKLGQYYTDQQYTYLQNFVAYHPDFQKRLPKMMECQDDGTGGFKTGLAVGLSLLVSKAQDR
jgi:hypothetical protein